MKVEESRRPTEEESELVKVFFENVFDAYFILILSAFYYVADLILMTAFGIVVCKWMILEDLMSYLFVLIQSNGVLCFLLGQWVKYGGGGDNNRVFKSLCRWKLLPYILVPHNTPRRHRMLHILQRMSSPPPPPPDHQLDSSIV